jgi:choline dehydrogenase-like flavoprotein
MLSGIGPADHLRSLNIRVVADLPVGDNLQDHIAVVNLYARTAPGEFHGAMRLDRVALSMLQAQLLRTGFATAVPSGVVGFVRIDPAAPSPDVEFMFPFSPPGAGPWFPGWRKPYADAFGIRPTILHPRSRGHVRLRSTNPLDPVRIAFNALTAREDIETLRQALRQGREIASQASLDPFRGAELSPGSGTVSDSDIDAFIRGTAITAHHPCATCPMGQSNTAVLDPELRVRGIDGLRVVDASAMPDIVSAHINACVLMMAERASDLIRGKDRPAIA